MFKIKNKISKMAPHKWDTAEGRISKLEDVPIGIIQTETQRRKKIKKKPTELSIQDVCCMGLYKI